ncbi:unnamed protein product [Rotaria sp. Silwood1]|nr:unnamed protein product [Rotaria sp. Silwood1]CAF4751252.1 unnamed protein product [Rotaria sp. Silwood1]
MDNFDYAAELSDFNHDWFVVYNGSRAQIEIKNDLCGSKSPYEEYYDADYFKWQKRHQMFQAAHSDPTRWGRIKPEYTVLEIGCSAGAVLNTAIG